MDAINLVNKIISERLELASASLQEDGTRAVDCFCSSFDTVLNKTRRSVEFSVMMVV